MVCEVRTVDARQRACSTTNSSQTYKANICWSRYLWSEYLQCSKCPQPTYCEYVLSSLFDRCTYALFKIPNEWVSWWAHTHTKCKHTDHTSDLWCDRYLIPTQGIRSNKIALCSVVNGAVFQCRHLLRSYALFRAMFEIRMIGACWSRCFITYPPARALSLSLPHSPYRFKPAFVIVCCVPLIFFPHG